jgi:hypothetical protein
VYGQFLLVLEMLLLNYGVAVVQAQDHVVANIQFKVQAEVRMQFVQ